MIFEGDFDAFKLNRFQPNFELSFFRAYQDDPKYHQGHQSPAPVRNAHNHHQLQQETQQYHQSFIGFLMP